MRLRSEHTVAVKIRLLRMGKRSEEHTSELQSQSNLVCRLLLEKKKTQQSDAKSQNQASIEYPRFFSTTSVSSNLQHEQSQQSHRSRSYSTFITNYRLDLPSTII